MIKGRYGDRLDAWVAAALGPLLRVPIPPTWLSVGGALLSVVAGVYLAAGSLRIGSLWIAAGAVCDLLDGPFARAQGRASRYGAFLDSTLDRVSDLAIYLGVVVWATRSGDGPLVVVAAAALSTALLTSYVKARAEALGAPLRGGVFERGERLAVLGFGAFFGWLELALWVLAIAGAVTVATRLAAARRALGSGGAPDDPTASHSQGDVAG